MSVNDQCILQIGEDLNSQLVFSPSCSDEVIQAVHSQFQTAAKSVGLYGVDQLETLGWQQLKAINWQTVRESVDLIECLLPDCANQIQFELQPTNPFETNPNKPSFLDRPVDIPNWIYLVIFVVAIYYVSKAYDIDLNKLKAFFTKYVRPRTS